MKKVLKFIGKFLLWMIAAIVLNFLILTIAIIIKGGPVSGANCNLLTIIIISILYGITYVRKNKKKE